MVKSLGNSCFLLINELNQLFKDDSIEVSPCFFFIFLFFSTIMAYNKEVVSEHDAKKKTFNTYSYISELRSKNTFLKVF